MSRRIDYNEYDPVMIDYEHTNAGEDSQAEPFF